MVGCVRRRSAHDDRKEPELPPAEDIGEWGLVMSWSIDVSEAMCAKLARLKKQPSSVRQKAPSMCWATHRNQSWETKQEDIRRLAVSSAVKMPRKHLEYKMHSQEHDTGFHRRHKNHARVGDQKNACWCCADFGSTFVWRLQITRRCCCKSWCQARSARIDGKTTACAGWERTAHRVESTRRGDKVAVKWKHPRPGPCAIHDLLKSPRTPWRY